MAVTAYKAHADARLGQSTDGRTRVVPWVVHGTSDADEALAALVDTSPPSEGGLVRSNIGELRMLGSSSWESDISYTPFVGGLPDPGTIGIEGRDSSFQFETGGGRRTVRMNVFCSAVQGPTGTPFIDPTGKEWRLINATPENGVEGVEIEASIFNFSITKTFSVGELSPSYVADIYSATNCANLYPVTLTAGGVTLNFAHGELLFKGASGGISDSDGRWRFTYNFTASKTLTETIEGFDPIEVPGWDYLEIKTVAKPDGVQQGDFVVPIREPKLLIKHVVYQYTDLNKLNI